MYTSSISAFKNYFESLEKVMALKNPHKVGLIKELKNISLKNATKKMSDEKTRQALERVLTKYNINPVAIRRNEQYAISVGLARQPFDGNNNGLTDLVEAGSKPGVNLLAGVRTKRNKGLLEDFKGMKSKSSNVNLMEDLQAKTKQSKSNNGLIGDLNKKAKSKLQPMNIMDLGRGVKSKQEGLGLGKFVSSPKGNLLGELDKQHSVSGLKINVDSNPKESVIGAFRDLSAKERKMNVRQRGLIGALAGAGKK